MSTIFSNALGTPRADGGQPSFRDVLSITGGSLGQVRVTFQSSGNFNLQNASIGIWSGTTMIAIATPVELLFGGASGFAISGPGSTTSDWVNLSGFTSSDQLVVVMDYDASGNGNTETDQSGTGGQNWFLFGESSYNKADPTADGAWGVVPWVVAIGLIETQSGGGGGPARRILSLLGAGL